MKIKTADRFSDRVANYVAHRPGYPPEMLTVFREEMGLSKGDIVADIGCGPGISSIPFLDAGCNVVGIEPNDQMREAAEKEMAAYANFRVIDGTATATGLEDESVDFVIAAQAFHWFRQDEAVNEFKRILRSGGFTALIWNERLLSGTPFLEAYEQLLVDFGTDYSTVRHDQITKAALESIFGATFRCATFENRQVLDLEGLKGRLLSASYTPSPGDPDFGPMIELVEQLFAQHNERGKITISYDTNVFYVQT